MKLLCTDPGTKLDITPSSTSSQHDFDFFTGKNWHIRNRKLKTRLAGCTEWIEFDAKQTVHKVLNGLGNIDHFYTSFDGVPFEGMTVRLFNPATRLWSIYWADSNKGILDTPVLGSFENRIGHFYTRDIFDNKEILVVFQWDATDPGQPIWSQAFSPDDGKTWEWNWYMYMKRVD